MVETASACAIPIAIAREYPHAVGAEWHTAAPRRDERGPKSATSTATGLRPQAYRTGTSYTSTNPTPGRAGWFVSASSKGRTTTE